MMQSKRYLTIMGHPWPETITVCGFEREKVSLDDLKGRLVDFALEELDEDYSTSNIYGDGSESTPKMLEAEKVFIEAIVSEYTPYDCDITTEVVVPVSEWIENHRPEWLEDAQVSSGN